MRVITVAESIPSVEATTASFASNPPLPSLGPLGRRSASRAASAAVCAAMIASACACVMVPLVTRPERIAATSSPRPILPAVFALPGVDTETLVTFVDFVAACETPNDPAVNATVVIATAKTFFFDDICMSPVPSFLKRQHRIC